MSAGLRALVLARRRRWLAARVLEAVLGAGGVAAATLAAQRLSGPADARAAGIAAALCAALAAGALLRERWRDESSYTRRLDARLGARGALVTACEFERRHAGDPFGELLSERTRRALDAGRWEGAASPPSPLALAALLGGLAVFAAVAAPQPSAGPVSVGAALGDLEALSRGAAPADVERALERLDGALAIAELAPGTERDVLRRRASALQRLAASSAGSGAAERPGGVGSEGSAAPGGAEGAGSGQATLAAGTGDRTMSRPDGPQPMLPDRTEPHDAERGAALPRPAPWPRRHDAVVAGYLERLPRD